MKNLSWLYILLILAGCTDMSVEDISTKSNEKFYATIEQTDSRTYVDGQIRLRWTAEDCITLFRKSTYNREYMFTGTTGANAGGFRQKSVDDDFWYGADVPYNYAIYPHSSTTQLDETDYFFTFTMPAEQTYAENSFGIGANTMVAVSESGQLTFKNVGSYLRVRLYGEDVSVSSITLTSKGNEAIAGTAKITPSKNSNPTCEMTGTGKSIRLICPEPVTVSTDANYPTDFWIVVPPVTLESGFSVTVENSTGDTQVYDVNKSFTFERNMYTDMKREIMIKNAPIYHVATAGTLSDLISDEEKTLITAMKVTGYLNGDDIRLIRKMLGRDVNSNYEDNETNNETGGLLTMLDISEATIKSGGNYYVDHFGEKYYTKDNVLGKHMFNRCNNLECILLPKNLSTIEDCAFGGCTSLTNVILYDGITKIEGSLYGGVFSNCEKLKSINIPNTVTEIGYGTFNGCKMLEEIIIPEGIKEIGPRAFGFCESLKSINIPSGLEWINESLFIGCKNLSSITIPNTITHILGRAFSGCENLTELIIPNNVCHLGDYDTFQNCHNLESIKLSNNITTIPYSAFGNCYSLLNITIPEKVGYIEKWAFASVFRSPKQPKLFRNNQT